MLLTLNSQEKMEHQTVHEDRSMEREGNFLGKMPTLSKEMERLEISVCDAGFQRPNGQAQVTSQPWKNTECCFQEHKNVNTMESSYGFTLTRT